MLLPLVAPHTEPRTPQADPPIRLKLSHDDLVRGDRARVKIRTAESGYLLVLRADADGRVRVLYPLDPDDEGRWVGGKEREVRGRGDREAFTVSEADGTGTIVAALSPEPFQFDDFIRNGHWDYRALADTTSSDDAEVRLVDLVQRMSGGHFDYDVAHYLVSAADDRGWNRGWYGPHYSGFYVPCIGCGPWYGGPGPGFRFGFGFGFGRPYPWWGRRW
jgi:hypothetical protein